MGVEFIQMLSIITGVQHVHCAPAVPINKYIYIWKPLRCAKYSLHCGFTLNVSAWAHLRQPTDSPSRNKRKINHFYHRMFRTWYKCTITFIDFPLNGKLQKLSLFFAQLSNHRTQLPLNCPIYGQFRRFCGNIVHLLYLPLLTFTTALLDISQELAVVNRIRCSFT